LIKKSVYVIINRMQIFISCGTRGTLWMFRDSGNSGKTAGAWLFFWFARLSAAWISAATKIWLADNSPQNSGIM
jgi:hypothetical protein